MPEAPDAGDEVDGGGADAEPFAVGPCEHEVTLISPANAEVGSLEIDHAGIGVCLHLEGGTSWRHHLMIGTDREDGDASSFELILVDGLGGELREGWDVTFGAEEPQTFASVEWIPWDDTVPADERVSDVVLWARAKGETATTSIDMALFDPLE